jgi:prepilin-type N-terminal cleavage/methylation domain-containing protein
MHYQTKQKAFSLIELIIVMVIASIIAISANLLLLGGFSAYSSGNNASYSDWQARVALERMARDIRSIRSTGDISTATSTALTFVDINGNNVSYTLSGTRLMLNNKVLADNVQNLNFTYYTKLGTTAAQISAISYIVISLNIAYNNISFNITTAVYPWNPS